MLLLGFGNKARHGKDTAAEAIRSYWEVRDRHAAFNSRHRGINHLSTKVGLFKFATALYQEVNDWLVTSEGRRFSGLDGILLHKHYVIERGNQKEILSPGGIYLGKEGKSDIILPDWVEPDPKPEVSSLAPYGKHAKLLQWWGTEYRRAQDPDYWTKKLFASVPSNLDIAMVTDVRFPNEADGIRQRGGYNINVQRLQKDGTPFFDFSRPADHPSETALDGYNWDFYLKIPDGHAALTGEFAVALTEYLRALEAK